MRDYVIYTHPVIGNFTIQDLIYFLELLYKKNKELDSVLIEILKNNGLDDDTIAEILNYSDTTQSLKFIVNILNDEL